MEKFNYNVKVTHTGEDLRVNLLLRADFRHYHWTSMLSLRKIDMFSFYVSMKGRFALCYRIRQVCNGLDWQFCWEC